MAILHMETEIAHDAQAKLMRTQQELLSQVTNMDSVMANFQPTWIGNSASQFFQEYNQWSNAMNAFLEELKKMGTNLDREIAEWENTASSA